MKNGKFVGKFEKSMTSEEITKIIRLVSNNIKKFPVNILSVSIEPDYNGRMITFNVSGLNFQNRDMRKAIVSPVTKIYLDFTSQWGYNDGTYELTQNITKDMCKVSSYGFNFRTDGRFKEYRCRTWYVLEGKGHYIYNDDLNDKVLNEEIYSYICNLFAQKGL